MRIRGISQLEADKVAEEPRSDVYADELKLFEDGELDQSLWAKHIVEAEGDSEKAKWRYIKERVANAHQRHN